MSGPGNREVRPEVICDWTGYWIITQEHYFPNVQRRVTIVGDYRGGIMPWIRTLLHPSQLHDLAAASQIIRLLQFLSNTASDK